VGLGVALGGETLAAGAVYGAVSVVLAGLVVVRHRGNLLRLRAGTEGRVGWAMGGSEA